MVPQQRECRLSLHVAVAACFVWVAAAGSDALAEDAPAKKATPALTELHLSDYRGRVWELDEFDDKQVIVVAFLGVECPLAKLYSQRLSELESQFSDRSVALIGVDANPQDSLAEMAAHARRHDLKFPLLRDSDQRLMQSLGATRTPEVFVLDRQRRIRYQGRIDDQYGIGYVREQPQNYLLRDAIEALLDGRDVLVAHEPAVGCLIGKAKRPVTAPNAAVTYSKDIAPIFKESCVQCHREGEIAPFPLTDYAEISGWAETIAEVVAERRMPPWHANPQYGEFANDCSLSDRERELVLKWVADGAPEGDPADLPPPRKFVSGWQLPREPDAVIEVSKKPVDIPAAGEVAYQYFEVDPGFTEEKWISAAQIVPGNRSVVHHILVFVRGPGEKDVQGGARGFLFGYVPGSLAQAFPPGAAKRVPAGSKLVFQVHYTPIGTPQTDQSRIGFVFADPESIEQEVVTTSVVQTKLNIPPEEGDYRTSAMLPEELPDGYLLGLAPHMHLRGKSFRYTLIGTDGSKDILLDVPHYDFNWQTGYRLAEPRKLVAGSRILGEASFDNSAGNLNNPDPSVWVKWGDQTTDEMMIGYFDILVPRGSAAADPREQLRRQAMRKLQAKGAFDKLDADQSGRLERKEIPQRWHNQFDLLDIDGNGTITRDEVWGNTPD